MKWLKYFNILLLKKVQIAAIGGLLLLSTVGVVALSQNNTSQAVRPVAGNIASKTSNVKVEQPAKAVAGESNVEAGKEASKPTTQPVNKSGGPATPAVSKPATSAIRTSQPPSSAAPPASAEVPAVNQIKSVTITANTALGAGCGAPVFPYSYLIEFTFGKTGTTIVPGWEYQTPGGQSLPYPMQLPFQSYPINGGTVSVRDNVISERGIPANFDFSYNVRLRVTGPNEVFSNWIAVPVANKC